MKIYHSDRGFLCAEVQGRYIHSKYNPHREAERFVARQIGGATPEIIILVGAGLGYINECIEKLYPGKTVLSLYLNDELYSNAYYKGNHTYHWHPLSTESIDVFFRKHIKEEHLSSLSVLEWEPCAQLYSELSLSINQSLKQIVQELNGNILTTAWFGKMWFRNTISNYLSNENYVVPDGISQPVLIASSGPSLSESFDEMRQYRQNYILLALPSSLPALIEARLIPDLQISTDPGYYSSYHLKYLFPKIPLAMPFTAGRGAWRKNSPIFPINQKTPFEKDLYSLTGLANYPVNSNGTVSGSALELASMYTNITYFAGLDLCFRDIQSHVKPHSFDSLLESRSSRVNPLQSVIYRRSHEAVPDFQKGIRTARSLDTYKNWFNQYSTRSGMSLYRINPSPVETESFKKASLSQLPDSSEGNTLRIRRIDVPSADIRRKHIKMLLNQWIDEQEKGLNDQFFYFLDAVNYTGRGDRSDSIQYLKRTRALYE